MMELETLRLEQEKLSMALPVLALQLNPSQAQLAFMGQMDRLREKSNRLERLIESMSLWGCEEDGFSFTRVFNSNASAA